MLSAGIQANSDWTPIKTFGGDNFRENDHKGFSDTPLLAAGFFIYAHVHRNSPVIQTGWKLFFAPLNYQSLYCAARMGLAPARAHGFHRVAFADIDAGLLQRFPDLFMFALGRQVGFLR